jgi:pyruvate/2-oxoacid:ferredoxin oxidoreductase alpha subunit
MLRPFPQNALRDACATARRIAVLDRNYAAGVGGIFCQEVRAALQGVSEALVQSYLAGVGGGDVVPAFIRKAIEDVARRDAPGAPFWLGLSA